MTRVAVVGATGVVGVEMLRVLEERGFPVSELRLLASPRSVGRRVDAFGAEHEVAAATSGSFAGIDLALFSAGSALARELSPHARDAGAIVVDNSSAFRMDPAVPLVIPELNATDLADHGGIIANPNCSTILLCMALDPLRRAAGLRRVVVCSYQAVSGAGARAMEELRRQEAADAAGGEPVAEVFPAPISHNVIPWVEALEKDGYSTEETKVMRETRRILGIAELPVAATCVRVPVLRAHAEAVHVELERPLTPAEAVAAFREAPGVCADGGGLPTPRDVAGTNEVVVGRIRPDRVFDPGLALWCVMDQLRKGAALNAVQIAERALRIATGA